MSHGILNMMVRELSLLWMVSQISATQVNQTNMNLSHIPANFPSNITSLILPHNHIKMDNDDLLILQNYSQLKELDLSYNLIEELPTDTFSSLRNLETLNLLENKLQTLSNKTHINNDKLKTLDLSDNPWNCSQQFLNLIKWINNQGMQTGSNVTCETPQELAGKNILDLIDRNVSTTIAAPQPTTSNKAPANPTDSSTTNTTIKTTQSSRRVESTTSSNHNISNKDTLVDAKTSEKKPGVNNTWKFLTGVIVIVLCTSMVIVCAVKSPSWYKMIFNYRHQRLREADDPVTSGRFSNFSLDTEQTETSANELDQDFSVTAEDEDGFIEDGYIQSGDYNDSVEVDEV